MKAERAKIVKILGSLCCLGIVVALFLPMYTVLGESLSFLECLEMTDDISESAKQGLAIGLCIAIFMFLFTYLAVYAHGESTGVGTAVLLFLLTLGDWFLYKEIEDIFFGLPFFSYVKGIGAHLMGWCFAGLLLSGILSLIFAIMGKGGEQEGKKQSEEIQYEPYEPTIPLACPECGKPYDKEDTFCGRCGYRFKKIACPRCGKEGDEGDLFCKKCGIHLVEVWKQEETEPEQAKDMVCSEDNAGIGVMPERSEQEAVEEAASAVEAEEEQFYTCITCGEKIPVTKRFCTRCGTKVEDK